MMQRISGKKLWLARVLAATGLGPSLHRARCRLMQPHIRVINYHDLSPSMLDAFEAQLRWFREHYVNADRAGLEALLGGGWDHERPGLAITFDDGLRSHFEYAAPLLEKYGFTGWFFVPVQFVDTDPLAQMSFAESNAIVVGEHDFEDERRAMSWDELRQLDARGHEIGSHTVHHTRLGTAIGDVELEAEVNQSRFRLEKELDRVVDVFCWVGGEESSYSRAAAATIREAGYRLSFMTNNMPITSGSDPLQIQRTNIEAWYPLHLVEFQLTGILDLLYAPKRRRVNSLTA